MFVKDEKNNIIIHKIKATKLLPLNWNDDTHTIATIQMSKGKFDQKLEEFIGKLKNWSDIV